MNKLGQLTDPALLSVIDDTVAAVTKAGKVTGIIPLPTRDASDCAARGFGIVIGECDVPTLKAGAMADLARHRKAFPGRR